MFQGTIPEECPGDLVYNSCGTACPNVCGQAPVESCIEVCVAECQCPDNMWLSGDDKCVMPKDCDKGNFIFVLLIFYKGQTHV